MLFKKITLTTVAILVVIAFIGCEQQAHLDPIVDSALSEKIAQQVEGQKLRQIATQVVPFAKRF